ncbi:lambda-exonuclease family protein [Sphingosinicella soli]|uniref:Putative phage-type endonuclease n=1 Tax=Sphingosinicella soli TaxID=333708 RepID=A0A7W7B4W6_9SPHN|nr:YqaJ viral recombinase family protein [Sphingosinicella soli]MBB4633198.1 putative phage-type endonuclease [Sphingosinicella soli]
MPFSVVDLDQGNARWLTWRSGGLGASDAPAVMGENPWKSRKRLLKEKIDALAGAVSQWRGNAVMARGNALEPEARRLYAGHTGRTVAPACLQSNRYEWMRASVDGICFASGAVVEIKCGDKAYAYSAEKRAAPRYYYGQLQHILAVTGYARIDYWCWVPGRSPQHIEVARDAPYIDRMLDAEAAFWDEVLAG